MFPVADQLRRRGVPFAFASGCGLEGLGPDLKDVPMILKPFKLCDLERNVEGKGVQVGLVCDEMNFGLEERVHGIRPSPDASCLAGLPTRCRKT